MWLNSDFAKGDLTLLAVHEAQHLRGRFHSDPKQDAKINAVDERAYQQLSEDAKATAPLSADKLYRQSNGRVGKPLPPGVTEPKE